MRRTWVKLYVDQCLRGSMMTELEPDERWVWVGFILLAGDCAHEGRICITETSGFTDQQLADLLKVDPGLIRKSKKKFVKYGKVEVEDSGIIIISKWHLYQSEYLRQKSYRVKLQGGLYDGVTISSPSISSSLIFSFSSLKWEGITEKDKREWAAAFPACDIELCLKQAGAWLAANPKKVKSEYRRFIVNWLKKEQDRGGMTASGKERGRPAGADEPEWMKRAAKLEQQEAERKKK